MRISIRSAGLVGTLAAALAAASIVAPAQGGLPAGSTPTTPQYIPAGLLAVSTGGTNPATNAPQPANVRFDSNKDGIAERTQSLATGANCYLSTTESLLRIDGAAPSIDGKDRASFLTGSIGVQEKNSGTGTSCYRVDSQSNPSKSEALTLSIKDGVGTDLLPKGALGPLVATSAYLDVELKQSAQILATAKLGGNQVATFGLISGTTTVPWPGGAPTGGVVTCANAADSGPDSGIGDNCRWPISVPSWLAAPGADYDSDNIAFDTLELKALNGSFSLEGGSDGAVPPVPSTLPLTYQRASMFELGQLSMGDLACGDTTSILANGSSPGVTVDRLATNADPSQTCVKVPYSLTNGSGYSRFLKPQDQQSTAQFVITMTWTVPASNGLPLPATFADYETPAPGTQIKLGWCPDPIYSGPDLVGIGSPLTNPGVVDQDEVPGIQFSCIGNQQSVILQGGAPGLADDTVQVTEQIYVLGDIYLRK